MNYKLFVIKEALPHVERFLKENNFDFSVVNNIEEVPVAEKDQKNIIYRINKGRFLTACPGTPKYICCGYYVLAPVENCPFSCTYCILNAYFKKRNITVYVNISDMIQELESSKYKKIKRIGTGEFSDSMAISQTLFYLPALLDFFSKNQDIYLELKTKSSFIPDNFFVNTYKNIIFSWSLNSEKVSKQEEINTSSIEERIQMAKKVCEHGYRVSFHFDPIIFYDGWKNDYQKTIDKIFKNIPAEKIVWISLGTLRFIPELKDIAIKLYPETTIFNNEFIRALDGKKRYFRKTRTQIYKQMLAMIHNYSNDVFVYLCMENEDVWSDVFGIKMTTHKLKELMDARL